MWRGCFGPLKESFTILDCPVSLGVYLSLMNLRSRQRLDYFALHSTGERIYKMEDDQGGDKVGAMKGTELKTREDLKFSLEIYEYVLHYKE